MVRHSVMHIFLLLCMLFLSVFGKAAWQNPGCHKLRHTRMVYIPGCIAVSVSTNGCRGYCTSYAIPSPFLTTEHNPHHVVTSHAECCSIQDTHDVHMTVRCIDGMRKLTFKSAASCACSVCRQT